MVEVLLHIVGIGSVGVCGLAFLAMLGACFVEPEGDDPC
jgi:hypothetical protein